MAIERFFSPFKYYDELFVLFFFLGTFFSKKLNLTRNSKLIIGFIVLLVVGLLGNHVSNSGQPIQAILQDILSNAKLIVFAIAVPSIDFSDRQRNKLEDYLANTIRFLFVFMLFTALISQVIDMTASQVRYGLKSYSFLYNNAAVLNTYYYLFMIIHSITLTKNGRLRNHSTLFTLIGLVPWILTLRSRAITFAVIYFIIYVYIIYFRKEGKKYKFRWYQIIVAFFASILLSWSAIEKYFIANDRVARYQLLYTSFKIAREYFPIGAGFGTFGTEASRAYYSDIYTRYGLSGIYGLNKDYSSFVTDQYWFAIIAQFGFIGTLITAIVLFTILRRIWRIANTEKSKQLAAITFIITNVFASLTAASFIQAAIIPSVMIFYLLCKNERIMNKHIISK